jgi:hypothetical protein
MAEQRFTVSAGPHARRHTPIAVELPGGVSRGRLTRSDTGKALPSQVIDAKLHFILDKLEAGEQCPLVFDADASPGGHRGVRVEQAKADGTIDIKVRSKPFTTYHYGDAPYRPYFYPFLGPGGVQITRNYPMRDDVAGESQDHIHQRSVWVGFGDVNGSDNWTEIEESGFQSPHDDLVVTSGAVLGRFSHTLDWQDRHRANQMRERRTVTVYNTPDNARLMELTVAFEAVYGEVRLGDTKEGGICSVRVAATMDAAKGGKFENSYGAIDDDEAWGKPAHWCDYSGPCEGRHVGIAVFDHPMNLRHPTTWHVRGYGLMGANPFAHADYKSSLLTDGSYTIAAGDTLTFNYRLLLHDGDAARGRVAERYHDYINPPAVEPAG